MKRLKQGFIQWGVVALLCLLLGFLLGKLKLDILQDSLALKEGVLHSLTLENEALSKKMAQADATMLTEQQTIKLLTLDNQKLNERLAVLSNKLYFYERVVAPESQAAGVQIYSFSVDKKNESDQWGYELILMQAQKGRRLLTGTLALNFSVEKDGQLQNVPLDELSDQIVSNFKFKYFQTIKGAFTLPPGMQIDEIILSLNVAGNRWYKAQQVEQRYSWKTLIQAKGGNVMGFDLNHL